MTRGHAGQDAMGQKAAGATGVWQGNSPPLLTGGSSGAGRHGLLPSLQGGQALLATRGATGEKAIKATEAKTASREVTQHKPDWASQVSAVIFYAPRPGDRRVPVLLIITLLLFCLTAPHHNSFFLLRQLSCYCKGRRTP